MQGRCLPIHSKHTAKVLIFPLLFVSLQPTLQYFKRIMAHNCENCKFRVRYDEKPNSFLGKFWRWHIKPKSLTVLRERILMKS